MRANIPTSGGFDTLQPVEDKKPTVTKEQAALAKIGSSPEWDILRDYINGRAEVYKNSLFGENLEGKDTSVLGQRLLAANTVVKEFLALVDEIDRTTKVVKEVRSGKKK